LFSGLLSVMIHKLAAGDLLVGGRSPGRPRIAGAVATMLHSAWARYLVAAQDFRHWRGAGPPTAA
jgi:hypothetical protein